MKTRKSFFLTQCIAACRYISFIIAIIHYCLLSARLIKVPLYILYSREGAVKNLARFWYTRTVRRVISVSVRSPLRMHTLRLVNSAVSLSSDSGCVIAICHTPWKRLLVQWCLENNAALIIGNGEWTHQKRQIQKQGEGFNDLRDIVSYLRRNGRLVVAFDCFNNNSNHSPLKFFGKYYNVSTLPARLARVAGVPLITAIPRFRDGTVNIDCGPRFDLTNLSDPADVMQTLISFLESEIKDNPGIWPAKYYRSISIKPTI